MEVVSAAGQELLDLTEALMSLERRPLEQAQASRSLVDSQISASRSLSSKLSSLRRLADDFAQIGALSPLRSFQISGDSSGAFTATAGSTASAGIHSVQVLALATRHSLASGVINTKGKDLAAAASVENKFTFEVTAGGETTQIEVEVDADADDDTILRAVVSAIDRSSAAIAASIARVGDSERKLLIQAEDSGSAAAITSIKDVEGSIISRLGLGKGLTKDGELGGTVQAASDASLVIDGLEISSSSNKIDDVISGVSLQLSAVTTGTASIEVARNPDTILGELKSFVDSYNTTLDEIRTATRPSDDSGANRGILADDTSFRLLRTSLRKLISDPVTLDSGTKTLASIGISVDREGRISLNESTLRSVLETDPETVENIIGGENGVAGRLAGLLESYSKTGGIVDRQLDAAERRRALYDARIASLNETLKVREQGLFQQLAELQAAIGTLSSQQSYLASYFASSTS